MQFLRLKDPLLAVLFEDDDIIAIDKPYGYNAHTNDSKVGNSDFVQDGLIEIYEKNRGQKLHIIHRLDQTTTGVMIFGKSTQSAKKYAEYFFNREVEKNYLFVTKNKSIQSKFLITDPIVHKAKELEAETEFELIKKSMLYELWKANPHTGRNHQIRLHARAANLQILGDTKYDGAQFPFLCLHNHQIKFPNGILIVSKNPVYFEDLSLLEDVTLVRSLFEIDRRDRLFSLSKISQESLRLVHSKQEPGTTGYQLDQIGNNLVLQWNQENVSKTDLDRFNFLSNYLKKPIVVRFSERNQFQLPENFKTLRWETKEKNICYEARVDTGTSVGLYTDQRLQRHWVLENAKGKSVLNLFAHTGSYSINAAIGQATQITSVENNKNALAWGKRNFELNSLNSENYIFLARDSLTYLAHCQSKNFKFDLVLCNAPSFLRREKNNFKIETGIEELLASCLSCLNPQGKLLFMTHFEGFYIENIVTAIRNVQKIHTHLKIEIECILASLDFELPQEKTILKSFLITTK